MDENLIIEEPDHKPSTLTRYIIRLVAVITLAVFITAVFQFNRNNATLQIGGVFDIDTKLSINEVDITILPAERNSEELNTEVYFGVKPPARIPIPGGKCSSVLVEAEGYHNWKHLFCPTYSEIINIELNLIPSHLPKPFPQEFET
jgi:hypothetical protein